MTKQEAEKLGWKFKGTDEDTEATKGRLISSGKLKFVLAMISMLDGKGI